MAEPIDTPDDGEAAELLGPEVMKEYRADCAAQLAALDGALDAGQPMSPEILEAVRLTAHRLSGSAGTYGYAEASRLAKSLENRVIAAKKESVAPDAAELRLAIRELRRALRLPE